MSAPPDPSRRHQGLVNALPPRVRVSPRDNHHLFWSRERMRQLDLLEFRELPCAIVHHGDSRIHTLVHQRFHQDGLQLRDRTEEFDLKIRAQLALRRHDEGWCSCALPQRLILVNALSLELLAEDEPPCLGYAVDRDLITIMRDYYQPVALIGPDLPRLLKERCQSRLCACRLENGHNALRPPGWHGDEPLSA